MNIIKIIININKPYWISLLALGLTLDSKFLLVKYQKTPKNMKKINPLCNTESVNRLIEKSIYKKFQEYKVIFLLDNYLIISTIGRRQTTLEIF